MYEHADLYTDVSGVFVMNMNFRSNWGYEIDVVAGKSKDQGHSIRRTRWTSACG